MKTIGILTSGGDAPGMNAAIRAITRSALANGLTVKGIKDGYDGLIRGDIINLDVSSVGDIIHRGGTVLGSARSKEMMTEEGQNKAVNTIKEHGIDGIVVIGGDGSFMGANALHNKGVYTIGIPGTIDNDMGYTEATIGFATACETVKESISKLRDTSASHGRGNVVEVMGRNCGDIALYAGVAAGAESILVPEIPIDMDQVINRMIRGRDRGKKHHIIVVAEGLENSAEIAQQVKEATGIETRLTIIGHVQRGGSPVVDDAILASKMGVKAVELLLEGQSSQAVGVKDGKIFNMPITEAVNVKREFNTELYAIANILTN